MELPKFGDRQRSTWNYLGNGKVPLPTVWKGIHIGDQTVATCKYLQKDMIDVSPRVQRLIVFKGVF